MADKYIIHGATFNGDGTSSAEATSDGGVGAWNNINIAHGTAPAYGSLAAGDVVTIRSKDAAGNDITVTYTANLVLGNAAGTNSDNIIWILDDGQVWPGVDGDLTFQTSGNYTFNAQPNNQYVSRRRLAWKIISTYAGFIALFGYVSGNFDGLLIDVSASDGGEPGYIQANSGIWRRCLVRYRRPCRYGIIGGMSSGAFCRFIDTDFEQTSSTGSYRGIFYFNNAGAHVFVTGGRFFGSGAGSSAAVLRQGASSGQRGQAARMIGFRVPPAVPVFSNMVDTSAPDYVTVDMSAADDLYGAFITRRWGHANSRLDGNFPYLNASLPDPAATGWSWQFLPISAIPYTPAIFEVAAQMYAGADSALTVTLHIQPTDTYAARLNTYNTWVEVSYIDAATGLPATCTSRIEPTDTPASLTAGATWSADYYGAITLTPKRLQVTTPTAVKQGTVMTVSIGTTEATVGASEMCFVCPAPQIS